MGPASSKYPNAIVVLGHSGTTGAESNPSSPGNDDTRNSWATGDNPAVNSVYARLLALNPAVRGHNTNLGVDGTNVDDLGDQVDSALALKPLPDLFMIQEVDNDMQCDGTDPDNYLRFAKSMSDQLAKITAEAPRATILLVSSPPGTVENYGTIASRLPAAKAANTGTGLCALFGPSGRAVPKHWRYQDQVIRAYQARLAARLQAVPDLPLRRWCAVSHGHQRRGPRRRRPSPLGCGSSQAGRSRVASPRTRLVALVDDRTDRQRPEGNASRAEQSATQAGAR